MNGIVSGHTTRTLLRYGIVVPTRAETAAATVIFQFDDVTIE
jgi:hypothetical protein